jgi:hypothetical protein
MVADRNKSLMQLCESRLKKSDADSEDPTRAATLVGGLSTVISFTNWSVSAKDRMFPLPLE